MNLKKPDSKHAKSMKRPQGSCILNLSESETSTFFDTKRSHYIMYSLTTGLHYFLVERDKDMVLTFFHFSPGTGTREVSVNINEIPKCNRLTIVLSWNTSEILMLATPSSEAGGASAKGKESKRVLRIDTKGKTHHLGNNKDDMFMIHYTENGKLIIQPTAIEVWKETLWALETLSKGTSPDEKLYEGIVSNLSIVMLVTGFETYTKKRFLEIEGEGIIPRMDKVINSFYSYKERQSNIAETIKKEANVKSISQLEYMVSNSVINFQSFDKSKKAFNKAYNLQFGNIGIKNTDLEELKNFFKYRHIIIHRHPAMTILNPEEAGINEQIKSDEKLVKKAMTLFNYFIITLHQKTLELVPVD